MKELVRREIREALSVYQELAENEDLYMPQLLDLVRVAVETLRQKGILIFAGNGGSFADAQHMAAEFTGKLNRTRDPLPAMVLGSNSSSMSAIGNDFGFEQSFARELKAYSANGACVIGFTTSGSSLNLMELGKVANQLSVPFFCFTGAKGGGVGAFGSLIRVPSTRTERVQEAHTTLGHIFCLMVEEKLGLFD